MPIPRIHLPVPLREGATVTLDERACRHVAQVLRLRAGDALTLFNGEGGEWRARLLVAHRNRCEAEVLEHVDVDRESPLRITLLQGVSRGERMDFTLQKATELGVHAIRPVFCTRTQVRLSGERLEKRMRHWQGILVHAAEQSGRTRLPELLPPCGFAEALAAHPSGLRLILDPREARTPDRLHADGGPVLLAAGPEGGFTEEERVAARASGFEGLRLGPRILRTETAALAALAAFQALWGDWRT